MDIFDCWIYIMKNMNMFEQMPFSEKGMSWTQIIQATGLTEDQLKQLQSQCMYISTRRFSQYKLPVRRSAGLQFYAEDLHIKVTKAGTATGIFYG